MLILTAVNDRGIRVGATVQNLFTSLKILGLAVLIVSAFLSPAHPAQPAPAQAFSFSHFGVAMIAGLWAYNGWFAISLVAGEIRNPQRNLPLSLMIGVTAVIGIYLLANIGYLRVLTVPEIAATERVSSTVGLSGHAARFCGRCSRICGEHAGCRPGPSLVGLTMIVSGVPAYFGWKWREQKKGRPQLAASRPSFLGEI